MGSKWISCMVKKAKVRFARAKFIVYKKVIWNIESRESEGQFIGLFCYLRYKSLACLFDGTKVVGESPNEGGHWFPSD